LRIDVEQIVDAVRGVSNEDRIQTILDVLARHPEEAQSLFGMLARDRDPVIRAWVPWAARRTLGASAVPIVKRLAGDRDSDVRDVAVEELLELDVGAARSLAPRLRQKLRSKEFYEPITAMWALAQLGDIASREAIGEVGSRATNALHRNTARVVGMLLSDDPEEVVRRVRAHDHTLMPWLAKGARLLRTEDARGALRSCAASAPDEECRRFCQAELDRLDGQGGHRAE
jgi:hypothetical protein